MAGLVSIALNSLIAACLFFAAWIYLKTTKEFTKPNVSTKNEINIEKVEDEKQQHSIPISEQVNTTKTQAKVVKQEERKPKCANNCDNYDKLKPCSRCRKVFYCGKACQMEHWKKGGHKQACLGGVNTPLSNKKSNTSSTSKSEEFGSTKSEREELVDELQELSKEERDMLLSEWDQMTPDQLTAPSLVELKEQLAVHKKEMSGLMYKAAYESMNEDDANSMVHRMRELKELIKLQQELIEYHRLEENARQKQDASKMKGGFYACMPCEPAVTDQTPK